MILTNLATVCRSSGLQVEEIAGWKNRGHGSFESIESITAHHTATPRTAAGDYPSLKVVRDGRPGLSGPLAQLGLGRSGKVYVIAAGVAWHAGVVFEEWQNNWHAIGIEAEHDGVSAWPAPQYMAYVRLCRTLADAYDVPYSRVVGHKEIAKPKGRKPDPIFSMPAFRSDVAHLDTTPSEDEVTPGDITAVAEKVVALLEPRLQAYKVSLTKWDQQTDDADAQRAGDAAEREILTEANLDRIAAAVVAKLQAAGQ